MSMCALVMPLSSDSLPDVAAITTRTMPCLNVIQSHGMKQVSETRFLVVCTGSMGDAGDLLLKMYEDLDQLAERLSGCNIFCTNCEVRVTTPLAADVWFRQQAGGKAAASQARTLHTSALLTFKLGRACVPRPYRCQLISHKTICL